jgi:hypothetical protein
MSQTIGYGFQINLAVATENPAKLKIIVPSSAPEMPESFFNTKNAATTERVDTIAANQVKLAGWPLPRKKGTANK